MRGIILIISTLLVGSCSCGSIPKAGPVTHQEQLSSSKLPQPSSGSSLNQQQKLELPAILQSDVIVSHLGYTASYNHSTLIPNWVAYELTDDELKGNLKGEESFRWDPDLDGDQAWREDYSNSGWDKGHMVPKADLKWSERAYSESFYFTNICPQNHTFNGGAWVTTENMGRRIAKQYGRVFIICGPLVESNKYGTIGTHGVVIPDAYFKAFLIKVEQEYYAIGIAMDNSPERQDLKSCTMTVDELESRCGLDLFYNLDINAQVKAESTINYKVWGL